LRQIEKLEILIARGGVKGEVEQKGEWTRDQSTIIPKPPPGFRDQFSEKHGVKESGERWETDT